MDLLEIFLGQIPEAIFLALFMIFAKALQKKRVLYVAIIIFEYLILKYSFHYSWYFHIGLTIATFLTLKVLYKEKSQITDVFILLIAYIVLVITSAFCFIICQKEVVIATILNRVIIFGLLFCFRNKLYNLQKLYKKLWNRSDEPKVIKSTTFRSLNVVIFNAMFVIFNVGMIYALYLVKKGGG